MKRLVSLLLVLFLIAGVTYAGDALTSKGDKALLFQFSGLSNLGATAYGSATKNIPIQDYTYNFTMYGLGMKYYFADDFAGTGALLFGMNSTTTKAAVAGDADTKDSKMGFGLDLGLKSNMMKSGPFVAFIGGGINFVFFSGTYEPQAYDPTKNDKYEGSAIDFGLNGLVGFEYFIYDRISLGAEYRLGFTTSSGSIDYTPAGGTTTKHDLPSEINIGFSTVSFTLAAYW
jgi:hypothetical protein